MVGKCKHLWSHTLMLAASGSLHLLSPIIFVLTSTKNKIRRHGVKRKFTFRDKRNLQSAKGSFWPSVWHWQWRHRVEFRLIALKDHWRSMGQRASSTKSRKRALLETHILFVYLNIFKVILSVVKNGTASANYWRREKFHLYLFSFWIVQVRL